jgi:hypothetical protein
MMNHLGSESTDIKERLESVRSTTAAQLENVAQMLQKLAGQFGGED